MWKLMIVFIFVHQFLTEIIHLLSDHEFMIFFHNFQYLDFIIHPLLDLSHMGWITMHSKITQRYSP